MKKLLMAATILAVAAFVMVGCSMLFGKTYVMNIPTMLCYEIKTTSLEVQADLEAAGFAEGSCPTTGSVGTCALTVQTASGKDVAETLYFYEASYTEADAKAYCDTTNGDWSSK